MYVRAHVQVWGNQLDNWLAKHRIARLNTHLMPDTCQDILSCNLSYVQSLGHVPSHLSDYVMPHTQKKTLYFSGHKMCSIKKNYFFSVPLSGTHQNEVSKKTTHFRKVFPNGL
jgi:hypothetical protein